MNQPASMPSAALPWPINMAGVGLIADSEGCRLRSYRCPAGVFTCGWGATAGVGPGMVWTQDYADKRLCEDVTATAKAVRRLITEEADSNQLAALVSFAYNLGDEAFAKSSVLKRHNKGDFIGAAKAMGLYNKAKVDGKLTVLPGLVTRRAAEAALYLKPEADAPAHAMPQEIAAPQSPAASTRIRTGAVISLAGLADMVSKSGDSLSSVNAAAAQAQTLGETLHLPHGWLLPTLAIAIGGFLIWHWIDQRRSGIV